MGGWGWITKSDIFSFPKHWELFSLQLFGRKRLIKFSSSVDSSLLEVRFYLTRIRNKESSGLISDEEGFMSVQVKILTLQLKKRDGQLREDGDWECTFVFIIFHISLENMNSISFRSPWLYWTPTQGKGQWFACRSVRITLKQQEGWALWKFSQKSSFWTQPHQPDKTHHEKDLIKQQILPLGDLYITKRQEAPRTKRIELWSQDYFISSVALSCKLFWGVIAWIYNYIFHKSQQKSHSLGLNIWLEREVGGQRMIKTAQSCGEEIPSKKRQWQQLCW